MDWTRGFTELDRKRHFIGEAVQEALSAWWEQYADTPPYELRVALSKAVTRSIPGEPWAEERVPGRSVLSNSEVKESK